MVFSKGKVGKRRAYDDADLGADHLGEADRAPDKTNILQAHEQPAARGSSARSAELLIYLEARGQERFDALFQNSRIVTASTQAICDAARALHDLGYLDELLLVARHQGANQIEQDLRENPRFRDRETDYGPLVPN